jgi:hypothetical protein
MSLATTNLHADNAPKPQYCLGIVDHDPNAGDSLIDYCYDHKKVNEQVENK